MRYDVLCVHTILVDSASKKDDYSQCRRFHRRLQLPFVPFVDLDIVFDDEPKTCPYPVKEICWDDGAQQFRISFGVWIIHDDKFETHLDNLHRRGWIEVTDAKAQD